MVSITCEDLFQRFDGGCCSSCHWDQEDGYSDLLEKEVGNFLITYCCARWMQAAEVYDDLAR